MAELSELIERVEKATGADRELDRDLHEALTGECVHRHTREEYCWDNIVICNDCGKEHPSQKWPWYTASLDAVVALVEKQRPGWACGVDSGPKTKIAFVDPHDFADRIFGARFTAEGPTPALALLLAFLKSHEGKQ